MVNVKNYVLQMLFHTLYRGSVPLTVCRSPGLLVLGVKLRSTKGKGIGTKASFLSEAQPGSFIVVIETLWVLCNCLIHTVICM